MLALNSNHIRLDWKKALKGRTKVVVGLSGGVDSAVSALRLKEAGIEVTGLFMKNWEDDDDDEHCSTRADFLDATSVAEVLGIDIEVVNFSAEYKDRVFAEFLREYQAGRTPNPDVLCNAEIKFTAFLEHAIARGAQCIATGHYAQIRDTEGSIELLRGADPAKDQTYFLHRLNQAQLAKTVFPLGDLTKSEVREIAKRAGLPNAEKKDSTGICFIGERPFREFLNRYVCAKPGLMKTPEGRCVGEHMGLAFYTLGQRKGLELGGDKAGDGRPWFVIDKDMATNTLVVAQGHDHPFLMSTSLSAIDARWISGRAPLNPPQLTAKTRYRQPDAVCTLSEFAEVGKGPENAFSLVFDEPQWAVTPGQSAVLYDGPICLGGGVIEKRGK